MKTNHFCITLFTLIIGIALFLMACSGGSSTNPDDEPNPGETTGSGTTNEDEEVNSSLTSDGTYIVKMVTTEYNVDGSISYRYTNTYLDQDLSHLLTSETDWDGDGEAEYTTVYTYDANVNLLTKDTTSADGTYLVKYTYTYDTNSWLLSETYEKLSNGVTEKSSYENTYDSKGNMTKTVSDSNGDGTADEIITATYDDNNNQLSIISDTNADGYTDEDYYYTYDSNNNAIKTEYDSNGNGSINETSERTFDANQNITSEKVFDADLELTSTYTATYNANNDKTYERYDYPDEDEWDSEYTYTYDSNYNLLTMVFQQVKGTETQSMRTATATYDSNGNKTSYCESVFGEECDMIRYEYDANQNLVTTTHDSENDGVLDSSYGNTYDQYGNQLSEVVYKIDDGSNVLYSLKTYEITYSDDLVTKCTDIDNDGTPGIADCDDNDPNTNLGTAEICDGEDNNCNGEVDENLSTDYYYVDVDGDGYGDEAAGGTKACTLFSGYADNNDDCDDTDASVNPGATEVADGIDNDCDHSIDEGSSSVDYYLDADGDGYGDPSQKKSSKYALDGYTINDEDCDDTDASVNPAATEVCDSADNDCDGDVDDDDSDIASGDITVTGATVWYEDSDGDGYGANFKKLRACTQPTGYVNQDGDCNDDRARIHECKEGTKTTSPHLQ